jgi:hypothetical protein
MFEDAAHEMDRDLNKVLCVPAIEDVASDPVRFLKMELCSPNPDSDPIDAIKLTSRVFVNELASPTDPDSDL